MALYLGREKIAVSIPTETQKFVEGIAYTSDGGVVTFPKLSFEPKMIAVWNTELVDLKEKAEEDGEEWDETIGARYLLDGFMVSAIRQEGYWISQSLTGGSGEMYLSNNSYNLDGDEETNNPPYGDNTITIDEDGCYQFRLGRGYQAYLDEIEVHYMIYG